MAYPVETTECNSCRPPLVSSPESLTSVHGGDWFDALSITSCGLPLDNESVRFGACMPAIGFSDYCPCDSRVDGPGRSSLVGGDRGD